MLSQPSDFAREFEPVAPALHAWAALRCRGPLGLAVEADDLFQDVALEAHLAYERYDPHAGSFRGWLFGVGARVAANRLRAAARRDAVLGQRPLDSLGREPFDEVTTISRRVRRDEALRSFLASVEQLDETERALLIHRGLEGLEHAEVAELVGLSAEASSKRWQRLRDRLRELPAARDLLADP